MNIHVPTSIAVLMALSSALLATQYASAQSPSGEESIRTRYSPEWPVDPVKQATLRELAVQTDYSRSDYRVHCLTPSKLHVRILDPLLLATLELDRERRVAGGSWSPWCVDRQNEYPPRVSTVEPVVMIQITADWGKTIGDHVGNWTLGGLGATNQPVHPLTSVSRMELLRDNIVVEPIRVAYSTGGRCDFCGLKTRESVPPHEYPPEAFTPGAKVVLRVWRDDNEQPNTMRLNERLLNSISRNFELYYEAMSSQ